MTVFEIWFCDVGSVFDGHVKVAVAVSMNNGA